jgi:hypothetical protein
MHREMVITVSRAASDASTSLSAPSGVVPRILSASTARCTAGRRRPTRAARCIRIRWWVVWGIPERCPVVTTGERHGNSLPAPIIPRCAAAATSLSVTPTAAVSTAARSPAAVNRAASRRHATSRGDFRRWRLLTRPDVRQPATLQRSHQLLVILGSDIAAVFLDADDAGRMPTLVEPASGGPRPVVARPIDRDVLQPRGHRHAGSLKLPY